VTIVLVVVVGVGAFFGGMKYQQSKQPAFARQFGAAQGGGTGGNRTGFRPVTGEIMASDDKTITVKLQDGSSKIVFFSDTTQINKAETASKSDLQTGQQVAVFGTQNSDGSVTAQNIQLNPSAFRGNPNSTP
jgi:hypothetical protein